MMVLNKFKKNCTTTCHFLKTQTTQNKQNKRAHNVILIFVRPILYIFFYQFNCYLSIYYNYGKAA